MSEYSEIINSQGYCMMWKDANNKNSLKDTIRHIIKDQLNEKKEKKMLDLWNATFTRNMYGLREYVETNLSKKLFTEIFSQFTF